jgi:hypothetical protein
MLLYFFTGELEWNNSDKSISDIEIINLKESVATNNKYPLVLLNYIKYIRSLEFEETPNYSIIIDSFNKEINLLV